MNFSICGTGMYVPDNIVTNDDMAKLVQTSDEWITKRVGIKERRLSTGETAADMACFASLAALKDSNFKACDIDLVLAATVSGETVTPGVACIVQKRLGLSCPAYDINAACSSFLFLLETAAGYFSRGRVKNVLIVCAERMSRLVDFSDRSSCVIFGDGAGAVVLTAGDGYIDSVVATKGDEDLIYIPQFAGSSPYFKGESEPPYLKMRGPDVFKFAVNALCADITELMTRNSLEPEKIKYIVLHQANLRITEFAVERLKMPPDKFYSNIERYGNTSCASIPIALDELNRTNKLNRGDLLILSAFGGGMSNAACLLRW